MVPDILNKQLEPQNFIMLRYLLPTDSPLTKQNETFEWLFYQKELLYVI